MRQAGSETIEAQRSLDNNGRGQAAMPTAIGGTILEEDTARSATMAVIERFRDRAGREVVLTSARLAHIMERHREIAGRVDEIQSTVEFPDLVTRDATYAHRENHYRRATHFAPYLKVVVVHYRPVPPQGTWTGEVITALPARVIHPQEHQLWP